jgi:hypothetical protein
VALREIFHSENALGIYQRCLDRSREFTRIPGRVYINIITKSTKGDFLKMTQENKGPSPRWQQIQLLLSQLRPVAWEPLSPEIKTMYGFSGYTKARNYCVYVLKSFTLPELKQIQETDLRELFMQALNGQNLTKTQKKNAKQGKGAKK